MPPHDPPPPRPARMPVVIPRPAPPRRRPAFWLSVLFVLLAVAAAGSYLATTTAAGRAVGAGVEAYVVDHWRLLLPVGIVGGLSWGVWAVRKLLSVLYRPTVNDFRTTTSVVVPSYPRGPGHPDALPRHLARAGPRPRSSSCSTSTTPRRSDRLLGPQRPAAPRDHVRARGQALGARRRHPRRPRRDPRARRLRHRWEPRPARRACRCRSSTPRSAAVGTQQNVYQRDTSVWRRVADWLVNLRYYDYVPAMGRAGAVRLRLRPHRGLPRAASCSRCSPTWRTSSSSAGAASPATTAG